MQHECSMCGASLLPGRKDGTREDGAYHCSECGQDHFLSRLPAPDGAIHVVHPPVVAAGA